MSEVWVDSYIFPEAYSVSNLGRVKSKERLVSNSRNTGTNKTWKEKFINGGMMTAGYKVVSLTFKGKTVRESVHRLVYFSFNRGANRDLVINHIDGNKLNNYISNLELVTVKENIHHAIRTGLTVHAKGEDCGNVIINETIAKKIIELRKSGIKYDDIAEKLNITHKIVGDICRGRTWKHIPR